MQLAGGGQGIGRRDTGQGGGGDCNDDTGGARVQLDGGGEEAWRGGVGRGGGVVLRACMGRWMQLTWACVYVSGCVAGDGGSFGLGTSRASTPACGPFCSAVEAAGA